MSTISTTKHIPYDLVSMAVILRDHYDMKQEGYANDTHKRLVSIADCLYNTGVGAGYLKPEYKALYDQYASEVPDFWDQVLDDAHAIDTQCYGGHVDELLQEYRQAVMTLKEEF